MMLRLRELSLLYISETIFIAVQVSVLETRF